MDEIKAAIVGIAGTELQPAEAALFRACPPAGVILFARNIRDPHQLATLMGDLRAVLPEGAVLMVDQEGGRVARLRPPHWRAHPAAGAIGAIYAADPTRGLRAAFLSGALIGLDCAAAGFDVVCAPVLDRRMPGAHDVVGDRAYGEDPEDIARLAAEFAAGLLAAGIQPVGKHAPGHGRVNVDTHLALPVVDEPAPVDLEADLLPFRRNAGLPWMMTAHIVYRAWDAELPGTLSPRVIDGVIRGRIGFTGVLASDDLAMHALSGTPAERACACLAAGCDIALYCPGDAPGTQAVLHEVPGLTDAATARLAAARAMASGAVAAERRLALDPAALQLERDGTLV